MKRPNSQPQQSTGRQEFRLFKVDSSPYYRVRFMIDGKRRQFSTGETMERAATHKARAILADIRSRGFKEAIALHAKKNDLIDNNPTIDEFIDYHKKLVATFDSPPSEKSLQSYARGFRKIASFAGASRLRDLTPDSVEKAKRKYLLHAAELGRDPNSIRITLGSLLRNAATLFSSEAMAAYRCDEFEIENPFLSVKVRGAKIKSYSPLSRDLLSRIWNNAHLLRDGSPDAPPPDPSLPPKRRIDFTLPHPDAFAILHLELGLGLRRNEADKAEWAWCMQSADGRRYLEVRETDLFIPKSKQSRIIPIADEVWEALLTVGTFGERFIVPKTVIRRRKSGQPEYRCDAGHRTLVEWLRRMGVESTKPCHALRKEFGSYVATSFSLFHAQRLLGHSSPIVTSAYYAGLTELPVLRPTFMGSSADKSSAVLGQSAS